MKLPNGDRAIVEIEKLTAYSLNPIHERGRHKARVFESALGIRIEDAEELRDEILQAAAVSDGAELVFKNTYGKTFVLDFELTRLGRSAKLRSFWIVRKGEDRPRLTTCFVL